MPLYYLFIHQFSVLDTYNWVIISETFINAKHTPLNAQLFFLFPKFYKLCFLFWAYLFQVTYKTIDARLSRLLALLTVSSWHFKYGELDNDNEKHFPAI